MPPTARKPVDTPRLDAGRPFASLRRGTGRWFAFRKGRAGRSFALPRRQAGPWLARGSAAALAAVLWLGGCERPSATARVDAGEAAEAVDLAYEAPGGAAARAGIEATAADREIAERTLAWARAEGLDTVDLGTAVARIGRRFVGAPYRPGTLDPPGPETLVVNLREFDCVTFVENALALARAARAPEPSFESFTRELERLRYRGGHRDGYESRLHYFSEWLADNARRGLLELRTEALGGEPDPEPIRFMTDHPDAYRQLADPDVRARIAEIERRLSQTPRNVLDERRIEAAEAGIRPGDVIAATSAIPGLDVAHTGIAVEVGGRIHLMHAPLVGDSVQISEVPLADRILRIQGQDGVMVARPI